jgi:hypothetical protein
MLRTISVFFQEHPAIMLGTYGSSRFLPWFLSVWLFFTAKFIRFKQGLNCYVIMYAWTRRSRSQRIERAPVFWPPEFVQGTHRPTHTAQFVLILLSFIAKVARKQPPPLSSCGRLPSPPGYLGGSVQSLQNIEHSVHACTTLTIPSSNILENYTMLTAPSCYSYETGHKIVK